MFFTLSIEPVDIWLVVDECSMVSGDWTGMASMHDQEDASNQILNTAK
jgi:hypothetical protein